ncbi:hypothetical protein [Thermoactinomyces sp. DSM 45892]|uniref:hypothetical protein n=1 Tax=Thermoactinomyces sp. DSM 45892 TaxID=1882753 RepID=UPI00089A645A|nr:hypothetical protein [Thermoactinomyces sp. DSM 45892]SDZ17929.1 hypothetical protein SAMN05444416_11570 [Thermoactinomyces sp. DSM 45892]
MEMSEKKRKTEEEVKKLSWIAMGQLEKATIYYLLMFVQFVEALESRKVDISPYRPELLFVLVNQLRVLLLRKKECYSLYWKDLDREILFSKKFYSNYEKLIVEIRKKNRRYQGQYPWDRILDELKRYKEYQILKKELEEDQSLYPPSSLMKKSGRPKSTPFLEKRKPTPFLEKRKPTTKKKSIEKGKASSWTKSSVADKQIIQPKSIKSAEGSSWKKVEEDRKQSIQQKMVENTKMPSVSSWTKFGEDEKRNTQRIEDEKQKSLIEDEKTSIKNEKTPLWKKFIKDRGFSKSLEQEDRQKREPSNQKEQPNPISEQKHREQAKIAHPTDHRKKEINWSRTGIRIVINHKS